MPPKGKTAPKKASKKNDDDELLLMQAVEAAKVANKELNDKKQVEAAKKREADKAAKEAAAAETKRMLEMPPIDVAAAAEALVAIAKPHALSHNGTMRDMTWLTYILHNVLTHAVEVKRRIVLRTAGPQSTPEPVTTFEVRDDKHPEDVHCWNVITTKTGSYAIDMTVDQFLPTGRHGYKRDGDKREGWQPVKAFSRLCHANGDERLGKETPVAIDAGVITSGRITVSEGVKAGASKAHHTFMRAAARGNNRNMSNDERHAAQILLSKEKGDGVVTAWMEMHEALQAKLYGA